MADYPNNDRWKTTATNGCILQPSQKKLDRLQQKQMKYQKLAHHKENFPLDRHVRESSTRVCYTRWSIDTSWSSWWWALVARNM
jgi:hypothetical protein